MGSVILSPDLLQAIMKNSNNKQGRYNFFTASISGLTTLLKRTLRVKLDYLTDDRFC